jgi:post-segregation antitoxin (ccd killing protein)
MKLQLDLRLLEKPAQDHAYNIRVNRELKYFVEKYDICVSGICRTAIVKEIKKRVSQESIRK